MDIGGVFLTLVAISILLLWIWSGIRAYKQGGSSGLTYFFFHLIGAIALVALLWFIIVQPQLECQGFLCGIEYLIAWMIISIVVLIVWPLVLIVLLNKKYGSIKKMKNKNENILDDEI